MEIINGKVTDRDEGWTIPGSDPKTTLWTLKIEDDKHGTQMYKSMDANLIEDYEGEIEVYNAKRSGKTYVRIPKSDKQVEQEQIAYDDQQDKRGEGITKSMAYKLAYHAFIQVETVLPDSPAAWEVIQDQAQRIYDGINNIGVTRLESGGDTTYQKLAIEPTIKDKVKKWQKEPAEDNPMLGEDDG